MTADLRLTGGILTIDLDAIAANYRLLAAKVAPAECAAVVKADGYGLGLAFVVPALLAAGAATFFVAHPAEGLTLRALAPEAVIGVLNGLLPGCEEDYCGHRLIPVLNQLSEVERWAAHGRTRRSPLPAFLHVDTGMNRLGLGPAELARLAGEPGLLTGLSLRAVMSHLACADQPDHPMTAAQLAAFRAARAVLPPAPASLANSSGIFRGPDIHFDLVRPGCALYGINPTPEAANPMRQTVRLDARILQVRTVDSPAVVGYGATPIDRLPCKIATIAVGYADGYLRSLGNRGSVCIAGRDAPVIGRVSMDLITVDVTDLPDDSVRPGGWAEILGPHRTPDEVARAAGTIGYEVLTALGRRYARRVIGAPVGGAALAGAAWAGA